LELPSTLIKVVEQFSKLQGIGEKTALRHVLSVTKWNTGDVHAFANALDSLANLKKCEDCGMFADDVFCEVCKSSDRENTKTLCVVESITDCLAIERSGQFGGLYHILGGTLNPLIGIGPEELGVHKILQRVKDKGIGEVILALNPSVEGDATCSYLREVLPEQIVVDRIGFGIPIGGSLEFLDSMTISKALENRRIM
jgi:recombination protein RecR